MHPNDYDCLFHGLFMNVSTQIIACCAYRCSYLRFPYSFRPRAESATFLFATMEITGPPKVFDINDMHSEQEGRLRLIRGQLHALTDKHRTGSMQSIGQRIVQLEYEMQTLHCREPTRWRDTGDGCEC